jgi:putative membrane protein
MKKLLWTALAALPLVAWAADKSPDDSFYKDAAQGGLAEVELGKLAHDKGQSQAVKDYGDMMVKDHTAANDKLRKIATGKGVDLPTSPSVGQLATKTKLEILSGDTFDKSFIKSMIGDHKDTIEAFEKEAQTGQDPDAQAFAKATLPKLHAHLKKIKSIAASAGISTD